MRNISVLDSGSGKQHVSEQIIPVDDPTLPYWRSQLHPIDDYRSSKNLPVECDIAIIGSGMAGVTTAYHLCQQMSEKPSIVMLEARQVCSGATGRNGGHSKVRSISLMKMIKEYGSAKAADFAAFVYEQKYAMKSCVEKEGLDCEFELRRSYDVFLDEGEAKEAKKWFYECLQEQHEWTRECDWIDERNVEQVTSMKGAKGAISVPACSFWPYKFVSQLLAKLMEDKLVNLQTRTPVTTIQHESGYSVLQTDQGALKARKVVFATNAYTGGLCDVYNGKIIPYKGTAVHIVPRVPVSPHLSHTYNISYAPEGLGVDYLNPRPDGGIVVGGGKWTYSQDRSSWFDTWDDSTLLPSVRPHFSSLMQRHFKGWEDSGAEINRIWTGIQGYTADERPHIGEVPGAEGQHYVLAGFNGGGMALIFTSARGVAKMIATGSSYKDTGLPSMFQTTRERLAAADTESYETRA